MTTSKSSTKIYQKLLRESRKLNGLCISCGKAPPVAGRVACERCRGVISRGVKKRYRELKAEVFSAYGGYVCRCCGETEPLFLCIDHMDGGGEKHRKEVGAIGRMFYHWLKKNNFPDGFQVLCNNCNMGKHLNGGVCPHETKGV